jgi:valyl-tRNA synthetase
MTFGTGASLVTPARDHNDFDVAKRHNLPIINIIDKKGYISMEGEFQGMHRFECRDKIVCSLEQKGLLRKKEPCSNMIDCCSRTGDIIEPLLTKQWFLNCDEMATKALKAVESGELKLIPESYNNVWYNWLKNIIFCKRR